MKHPDDNLIGKTGTFAVPIRNAESSTLVIPIKIVGVRPKFGRLDVMIEPAGGSGSAWVRKDKITITP